MTDHESASRSSPSACSTSTDAEHVIAPKIMRGTIALGLTFTLAALLACKSSTNGKITVDGAGFDVSECRSGQANVPKFEGVDFLDKSGRRVRFLREPNGKVQVYFFPPGVTFTDMLGENCGTASIENMNSEINGVKNIKGSVTANCTGDGHKVIANVTFEDCH